MIHSNKYVFEPTYETYILEAKAIFEKKGMQKKQLKKNSK